MTTLLSVALGGAIGASLRYLAGLAVLRVWSGAFPLGVLSVNVIGSFLMGLAVVYIGTRGAPHLGPFVLTGILGGFTTFSAFSLEAVTLFERGAIGSAALYVSLSVVCSIGALAAGVALARGVWA